MEIEKEKAPKDWKLIGFFAPPEIEAKLSKMAEARGLDKSKLLREIIGDFLDLHDPKDIKKSKSEVKSYLQGKKVPDDLINKVLKSL